MMYDLERRRITVYKYLKGNIKERERLFTAVERTLTGNKSLHLGAGENWVGLGEKTSIIRVIKQRNVILTLVCVVRSQRAGISDVSQTEDPRMSVNHIFLVSLCALLFLPSV